MAVPLHIVDAFTDHAFAGNQAAVCLLDRSASKAWMQAVAAEMNLSETAFLRQGDDGYELRWFTPVTEVDLCGHATLASAHVLWESEAVARTETIRFHTASGVLSARESADGIVLDFPAEPAKPANPPDGLVEALGVTPTHVGSNRMDLLVVLATAAEVAAVKPDMAALARIPARGVIVTAPGDDKDVDFVSRFFAPRAGIAEDPVTGSAHCCLAPYWAERLDRSRLKAAQLSSRGGRLTVSVSNDRVLIAGHAVTVVSGRLLSNPI